MKTGGRYYAMIVDDQCPFRGFFWNIVIIRDCIPDLLLFEDISRI